MKKGKISENVLKRSVLKNIETNRKETIKGAGIGSDCAFFRYGDSFPHDEMIHEYFAASTETITLPVEDAGRTAVLAAANNLAAGGAECFAVMLSLTLPEESEEALLQKLMKQIENVCAELAIQIAGGHTEISSAVKNPVITVTALGKPMTDEPGNLLRPCEPEKSSSITELDIVMTKWIGLEGTMILAREKEKDLLTRYPLSLIKAAQGFEKYLPILPEAATALKSGVCTMHDLRNGGVFGGLWELSRSMGVGLSIDLKKIPVKQETIEICEFFDLNPYEFLSGGSLLIATADGEELVEKLMETGVFAAVIGRTTDSNDKIIRNEEEVRFLEPTKPDEILKVSFS